MAGTPAKSNFPAAYCYTCEKWLSPLGSRKSAREAAKKHEKNRKKFSGIRHNAAVYDDPDTYREQAERKAGN